MANDFTRDQEFQEMVADLLSLAPEERQPFLDDLRETIDEKVFMALVSQLNQTVEVGVPTPADSEEEVSVELQAVISEVEAETVTQIERDETVETRAITEAPASEETTQADQPETIIDGDVKIVTAPTAQGETAEPSTDDESDYIAFLHDVAAELLVENADHVCGWERVVSSSNILEAVLNEMIDGFLDSEDPDVIAVTSSRSARKDAQNILARWQKREKALTFVSESFSSEEGLASAHAQGLITDHEYAAIWQEVQKRQIAAERELAAGIESEYADRDMERVLDDLEMIDDELADQRRKTRNLKRAIIDQVESPVGGRRGPRFRERDESEESPLEAEARKLLEMTEPEQRRYYRRLLQQGLSSEDIREIQHHVERLRQIRAKEEQLAQITQIASSFRRDVYRRWENERVVEIFSLRALQCFVDQLGNLRHELDRLRNPQPRDRDFTHVPPRTVSAAKPTPPEQVSNAADRAAVIAAIRRMITEEIARIGGDREKFAKSPIPALRRLLSRVQHLDAMSGQEMLKQAASGDRDFPRRLLQTVQKRSETIKIAAGETK